MSSSETTSVSQNSLNERKEDNYRRDSFDDRFCDDLCEEILQYLSLEDKLRLQCVSKQFQRTVFQRQNKLFINIKGSKVFLKNKDFREKRVIYYYIEDQSLHTFKALLKKCPNITSIEFNKDFKYMINQVFQVIIENCNNLREVMVWNPIIDSNFEEFHQKFGPKIKFFQSYRKLIDLNRFQNIEKIEIDEMMTIYDNPIISQLKLPKLKKLKMHLDEGEEHMLQTFIDTFPTLTHLNVVFTTEDENTIYKSLKNISNLKHLIHFKFINNFGININTFCGLLKQMANNSQNLKSIDCRFKIDDKNSNLKQLLSQLKAFPAFKKLKLYFYVDNEFEDNIDVNQLFSFELFKGLSNITHLSLHLNSYKTLSEESLKHIEINLPNLQYLKISDYFDTSPEGVTQMADILSRLSRLETLKLKFKSEVDFKPIEEQITKKCRKIKVIEMNNLNL